MLRRLNKSLLIATVALLSLEASALPVDWHGTFGIDSTVLNNFRRIGAKTVNSTGDGTQEVGLDSGNESNASWQSYVFKLNPTIVVNDAATFIAEMTTGYASGGFLGDSSQTDKGNNNNAQLFYHNNASGSGLNLKKAYIELHSDTALYVLGRHTYHWGLGAIYNEGQNSFDRHSTSRDGVTMKLKIGNFNVSPYWSKVANTGYTDATNRKEYGVGMLYDNPDKDIAFGLLYGKKSSGALNTNYTTTINGTSQTMGASDIKVTDIYFNKIFGKFNFAVEVPLMSGNMGKTNSTSNETSYSAKALLFQSNFKYSDNWTFGLDAGRVSGHDGSSAKFGALYLNPNFQIANLLFKYNLNAVGTTSQSIYDSYITNVMYLKLKSTYNTEKWTFDSALIYAKAEETAKAGSTAYNHTKNKIFTAATNQSDSYGTEIDMNAIYHWNNEISVGGSLGYLLTGDYFSFTNSNSQTNSTKNSMLLQMNTVLTF